jgi:carboxypeptidase C (cathepsin A)
MEDHSTDAYRVPKLTVWTLLQGFYTQFPQYENRDFGIFTESYGGHYGPEFTYYFEQQNAAIAAGTITGHKINIVALGVNNGWFDPATGYKAYIDYSYSNPYRQLISAANRTSYMNSYNTQCLPALQTCDQTASNRDCVDADNLCYNTIEGPLSQTANFDVYDIRQPSADPYPPSTYVSYLQSSAVMKAIGAQSTYQECPNAPYRKFSATGDGKIFALLITNV